MHLPSRCWVLHKHVTHSWNMSSGNSIVVLDLGTCQGRARVGSGWPLLSTCCPYLHWALTSLPQQVVLEGGGFSEEDLRPEWLMILPSVVDLENT